MTTFAKAQVHMKCTYFTYALKQVLDKYPNKGGVGWMDCCEAAVNVLREVPMGIPPLKSYKTVQKWYVEFCDSNKKVVVPSVSMKRKNLPPIFAVYPDLQEVIIDFCSNNIGELPVDTSHEYINKCLQIMTQHDSLSEINNDESDDESNNESSDEGKKVKVWHIERVADKTSLLERLTEAARESSHSDLV
eukprot:9810421-Ditylum_brightwellii.AAC.1